MFTGKFLPVFAVTLLLPLAACSKKPVADNIAPQAQSGQSDAAAHTAHAAHADSAVAANGGKADASPNEITVQSAGKLDTIYFEYDSFVLTADARQILEKNANLLRNKAGEKIVIKGHTDERGSDAYNLALGERRARAAYNYLVTLGVPAERLSIVSYGEEQPVIAGQDEATWAQNRRAEF